MKVGDLVKFKGTSGNNAALGIVVEHCIGSYSYANKRGGWWVVWHFGIKVFHKENNLEVIHG